MAKRVAKKTAVPAYTPCLLRFIEGNGVMYNEYPESADAEEQVLDDWSNDKDIVRVEKYSLSLVAVAVRHKSPFTFTSVEK